MCRRLELIAGVTVIDVAAGDVIRYDLTGPAWSKVHDDRITAPFAQYSSVFGRRRPDGGLPPGTYVARIQVLRGDEVLDEVTVSAHVADDR